MASSMSTFEIFWWVVSDMSISSIIVGRRMCRVSAKRWKLFFYQRTREKGVFLTQRCRFRHENTEFAPKISISTQKHQVKNTVFESKLSISTQKYRFWTSYTDFDSKIPILARNAVLFTCSVVIIIDLMYLLGVTFEASPSENSKIHKTHFGPKMTNFLNLARDQQFKPHENLFFTWLLSLFDFPVIKTGPNRITPRKIFHFGYWRNEKNILPIFQKVLESF